MMKDKAIRLLSDRLFLDKLYAYAYRRCNTSCEAEDLCSDMILAVLKALRGSGEIRDFYALAWTVARRTYADYCDKRKKENARFITVEDVEAEFRESGFPGGYPAASSAENVVEELFDREEERRQLQNVFREISFLSRTYRGVMVMYYLEGKKISEIADAMAVTETTVKQRLFTARRTIRSTVCNETGRTKTGSGKGAEAMEAVNSDRSLTNRTLQPVSLSFSGFGDPVGNNPCEKAERILSQNLVYLCRSRARTASELARELDVPMPYIEQELEIQCRGANGEYGLLQRTAQGRYLANILVVEREEYLAANDIYRRYTEAVCRCVAGNVETGREKILRLSRLCGLDDFRLPLWSLIHKVLQFFCRQVQLELKGSFPGVKPSERPYTAVALADVEDILPHFYGCNGIRAQQICGYSDVYAENLSGKRLQLHFGSSHNISGDPVMLLTIRCAGGLPLASLTGEEREIAARAIQCGYLKRDGDMAAPAIVVLLRDSETFHIFRELLDDLKIGIREHAPALAEELAVFMKEHIPPHLIGDYPYYNTNVASCFFFNDAVEECISRGILNAPENPLGPEGVLMVLTA